MAKQVFLDFEKQIEELQSKIDELNEMQEKDEGKKIDLSSEIEQLQHKTEELLKETYAELTPWQTSLVARHPQRPYMLDYVNMVFTDFHELHGDRAYADDTSIVGGLARLAGQPVVVIGHQKGRDTKERMMRNFGMSRPEGYRKALRLMRLAEKFSLPVFTFIDTPGAYPGKEAEERGQGEAIARSLFEEGRFTSHRGAYGEAEIPEFRKEVRNAFAKRRIFRQIVLHENEKVDVGVGIEFFSPAAAHGHEGEAFAREVIEIGERR